jgi:hypothetical protein
MKSGQSSWPQCPPRDARAARWCGTKYEVDDVRCSDGRMYDLSFDREFKFINKKPN